MSTSKNNNKMKFSTFLIFLIGALGGLLFGFDTGIISGASPLIETNFHLTITETGFITSSVLVGSAIGALCIGSLSDHYGRKRLLQWSAVLFLIGSALSMFAVGFVSMIIARIILGFAVGAASALTPAYLVELADTKHRGSLGTMFQLMITLGILLAYVSNLGFLHHNLLGVRDWRWMLGSALIPSLLLFFGSLILPESPRYLVKHGYISRARNILHKLRAGTSDDPDKELAGIEKLMSKKQGGLKTLFKIATPSILITIGLMFFQQFAGINAVIYFLPQIFIKSFHFATSDSIWISIGVGIVNFVSTVVAYKIMDHFNRKSVLIFGSIVMTVSLGLLAILNYTLSPSSTAVPTIILIMIYIVGFAVSWGPLVWVIMNEILPFSVRGVGAAIGSATNWICDFIVSQTLLTLLTFFGNNVGGPFAIYAILSFISMFFVIFLVPETRGKSLEQIETNEINRFHRKHAETK